MLLAKGAYASETINGTYVFTTCYAGYDEAQCRCLSWKNYCMVYKGLPLVQQISRSKGATDRAGS